MSLKLPTSLALITAIATAASTAFAALTGSITVSGSVPAATAVVVTGVAGYNALDLTTSATDLSVASVREINNTTGGYTVTAASSNSGQLKNGSLGSVAYTAKYNGTSFSLSSTPVTVTTGAASNTVVNVVKSLQISYTGQSAQNLMAGTYSDTLTFTIAAP